jgi:ATP-binding cassette subfamily F protein 3
LRPPLVTLDMAAVGYGETPVLSRLNLRLDPDDRIALLGRNGNGKTTLARLLAAQLPPMEGGVTASGKMKVGYFTQYQVEELDGADTPYQHMARLMKGATPSAVRSQLGRFGFSGDKALTEVRKLSGGERARLALALITKDAPHLLILDEPTNHLDVDAREALVQALNDYSGAVVVVSHDRHMLQLTADRLVLVDGGTATEFDGSLDDYTAMVLAGDGARRLEAAAQDQPQGRTPRRRRRPREEPGASCRGEEGGGRDRPPRSAEERDRPSDVRPIRRRGEPGQAHHDRADEEAGRGRAQAGGRRGTLAGSERGA